MLTRAPSSPSTCRYGPYRPTRATTGLPSVLGGPQRDRVDAAGVDLLEPLADDLLEAAGLGDAAGVPALAAEVELGQPVDPLQVAVGDLVELLLQRGGEVVVDELGEVLLEQVHHGEGDERGHQRVALLPDVPAVLDRLHDRRVGRRPADAQLLEPGDQARLGVAGRRAGGVALGVQLLGVELLAALQAGQPALGVVAARSSSPVAGRSRRGDST